MNICSWIFTGFFLISLILYVFFYVKKNNLLTKIFSCLPLPLMGMTIIAVLFSFRPDSFNVITFLFFSYLFCTSGKILQELSEKNLFLTIGKSLYALSAVTFILLFRTIFYIHHISQWCTVGAIFVSIGISVALILVIKHQSPVFYVTLILIELATTLFSYISLLTLIYDPQLYSVILFIGAIFCQIYPTFHLLDVKKLKLKKGKLIKQILLLVSQSLVSIACVLIFI